MQNRDTYHNCSSPCELCIRNLNVIARLNLNSSLREAYHFGGVVSPAFKSHTTSATMICLVFNVLNVAACVYMNFHLPASSDKTLVNCRASFGPSLCYVLTSVFFVPVHPPLHKCQSELPKIQNCLGHTLHKRLEWLPNINRTQKLSPSRHHLPPSPHLTPLPPSSRSRIKDNTRSS